jgi:molybdate transport system substrate-binding protein
MHGMRRRSGQARRSGSLVTAASALALALVLLFAPVKATPQGGPPGVLIFAAASLQTAIDELAPMVEASTGVHVRASYAASSTLARQIENGAPADLFISADLDWMDYLADRALIRTDTRVNLLGNHLVLIAPAGEPTTLHVTPGFPLAAALGANGRLAVADPDAVPAGKYAKAALSALGVWDSVRGKLARAENVRAALLLVERGEAPLGIVYRTDAAVDPGVVVVDRFPDGTHAPIIYPAALTRTAHEDAARVLTFLQGPAARAVFERLGFETKR